MSEPVVVHVLDAEGRAHPDGLIAPTDLEQVHEAHFAGLRAFLALPNGTFVEWGAGVGLLRRRHSIAVEVHLRPGHTLSTPVPTDVTDGRHGAAVGA